MYYFFYTEEGMVLTPLSTLFQLYRGGKCYWWRTPEYPEKTTDLPQFKSLTYLLFTSSLS
jgi:hypothetical protein